VGPIPPLRDSESSLVYAPLPIRWLLDETESTSLTPGLVTIWRGDTGVSSPPGLGTYRPLGAVKGVSAAAETKEAWLLTLGETRGLFEEPHALVTPMF